MDFRRLSVALAAQAGVFAAGALALLALIHMLYATSFLCALFGVFMVYVAARQVMTAQAFSPRRPDAKAIYTAELTRRRLQVLLDRSPSPLLLRQADGQLIAVNRAARTLFDVAYALPAATRRVFGDTNGQVVWQGATYALERSRSESGDEISELIVMSDISAEVRAAEATVLRDLLRVLNHELMNALTPITSMSRTALDILRDGKPQGVPKATRALERIVARSDGLAHFLDAYRQLTRLPPPELRPVALSPWLDVVRDTFAAQWQTQGVTLDIQADAVEAMMDADQMWLCVGNLLNNAAQAALTRPDPRVRLELRNVNGRPVFRIQDSGPGIAPDHEAQIFLPFFTTRPHGTGVGLSLARQIVQSHGGQLRLVADRGPDDLPGACFVFDLADPAVGA